MRKWLTYIHFPGWLLVILVIVFLLRIPSLFEPYFYGDEMIYLSLGEGMRQGLSLYKELHDNKPPLLYLTAAISGSLFWFKAILMFWSLITVAAFYRLSKKIFIKNIRAQFVSTLIFALLSSLPLLEGNIVNSELFMLGFTIMAFNLLLSEKTGSKKIFLAGTLLGIGTLFKIPAAFDLPVIIVYWITVKGFKEFKIVFKDSLILVAGFLLPLLITFLWFFGQGSLSEYIKAAFMQNVGYLSSYRPDDIQKPFYIKNAPLLIRAFIVFMGSVIMFSFRKKLSKSFIFLTLWILLSLFAVTLSERPYPHYLIQSVGPIALLLGMFFAEQSIEQSLTVIPLALSLFVPVYYKFYHYESLSYYQRFINFTLGQSDKNTYIQSFTPTVKRNYELAKFLSISSRRSDRVFMWDPDSSVVYALSRRLPPIKYVADYHINDFTNKAIVAEEIIKNPPKFIITTSGHHFSELNLFIKERYLLITQIENANVYSRIDFAPRP